MTWPDRCRTFRERLPRVQPDRQASQETAARLVGFTTQTWRNWEKGYFQPFPSSREVAENRMAAIEAANREGAGE
jgi:DNA-binding XRE family transcriptional regulator